MVIYITIILTFISIFICLVLAQRKGYSPLWALLFGWAWITPLIYLIVPDRSRGKELGKSFENVKDVNRNKAPDELMKRCGYCKNLIAITATSCDKCGASF